MSEREDRKEEMAEGEALESVSAEEEAAFLAEMADESTDGDAAAPAPEDEARPDDDGEEPEEDSGEEDSGEEEAEPERHEVIAGYTEEEIRAKFEQLDKLQKALDTTNGTLGSRLANQEKLIQSLQEQRSGQRLVGTLHPRVIARLEEEFPELAELLKPDDETDELIQGLEAQAVTDPELIDKKVEERISEFIRKQEEKEHQRELRTLTKRHPDWQDIATYSVTDNGIIMWKDPAFGQFVAGLSSEEQDALINGWDAEFVSDVISAFKSSQKQEQSKPKKKRPSLDAAVRPRGVSGSKMLSDEEEEEAAFRKEMASL